MNYDNTLVVNLVAGPCSGKSTVAAELFSALKKLNVSCELATEYIKDRIYEENLTIIKDQIALFGMEHYGLITKLNKVDVIIHDGSLLNNIIYDPDNNKYLAELVREEYFKFNNLDFFINRGDIGFQTYGRIHNLKESLDIDNKIKNLYKLYNASVIEVTNKTAVEEMVPVILKKLKEMKENENLGK